MSRFKRSLSPPPELGGLVDGLELLPPGAVLAEPEPKELPPLDDELKVERESRLKLPELPERESRLELELPDRESRLKPELPLEPKGELELELDDV